MSDERGTVRGEWLIATGRWLIVAWQQVNRNHRLLVNVPAVRLMVKIINGFNRLNGNFRLRDFMVRCTLGHVP